MRPKKEKNGVKPHKLRISLQIVQCMKLTKEKENKIAYVDRLNNSIKQINYGNKDMLLFEIDTMMWRNCFFLLFNSSLIFFCLFG